MGLADTAYHEAGHAVANFLLGIRIVHVSIIPDEDSLGRVKHNRPFLRSKIADFDITHRDRERLEHRIIALYAGPVAAERRAGSKPDLSKAGNAGDMQQIGELGHLGRGLFDMHPDEQTAYLEWLLVRACLLVDDGWFLVEPLAAELLARRTVSGRAVYALLRSVVEETAKHLMPEAFLPSTISIGGKATTLPPVINPAEMNAYNWRAFARQVAAMSGTDPDSAAEQRRTTQPCETEQFDVGSRSRGY